MPRRNGNSERDTARRWRTRGQRLRKGKARQSVKDKRKEKTG